MKLRVAKVGSSPLISEGDGSRYRYIGDDAPAAKEQNGYSVTASNRASSRVALYANGQAVGVTRSSNYVSNERAYFGTDLMGTVRSSTTDSGNAEYYEYDVFGKPYGETVNDYAYTGKPYDPVTGMYNYGYRDYIPQTARFTTIDPIRDGNNWFAYCNNEPVNFLDLWGLDTKDVKTTVVIIRNTDGNGNAFDSDRYIYKDDGKTKEIVFHDKVGANCRDIYNNANSFTEPDGEYYYTFDGLTKNDDGTYDSETYKNVIRHMTDDPNIPEDKRNKINNDPGDFLDHANQFKDDENPYNNNKTPGSAGCTIGKNGQAQQDAYMEALMDGVTDPSQIRRVIHSYSNGDR